MFEYTAGGPGNFLLTANTHTWKKVLCRPMDANTGDGSACELEISSALMPWCCKYNLLFFDGYVIISVTETGCTHGQFQNSSFPPEWNGF